MSRHRQPLEAARLKGADRKHPERYRAVVPKSSHPLGEVPDWLSPGAKAAWSELEARALDGVLTGADRVALSILAELVAQLRDDARAMPAARIGHMVGLLARLGFTADDTQSAANEPQGNPFNSF